MTKLEWLEIDNFRGISHLKYEPKQINLLIGRNNSGKTSVLEAIYLALTGGWGSGDNSVGMFATPNYNVRLHSDSAVLRCPEHKYILYNDIRKVPPEYQTRAMELLEKRLVRALSKYEKSDETVNNRILIQKLKKYVTDKFEVNVSIYDDKININTNFRVDSVIDVDKSLKELYGVLNKDSGEPDKKETFPLFELLFRMSVLEDLDTDDNTTNATLPKNDNVIYITNSNKFSEDIFTDPAILLELDEFVLENNLVPNLKRLMEDTVAYQYNNDKTDFLPYSVHGTGFTVLLGILYRMKQASNGVLLIEEPENHLHPGYLSKFVEQLMELAAMLNIQIFMTSHSYDLIRELSRYPENNIEMNMIQITNLVNRNGIHEIHNYSPEDGWDTINRLKIDLRGP